MEKIILIDSNSLINRAFYALPPLQNKDGQFTNAIYGFVSMLQKLINEEKPTHICAVFDSRKRTFRKEMYEGYKAKRKPMPDALAEQVPMLKELLRDMNIKILTLDGFEADDIIGTIAKRFNKDTIVVSGDKDCLQLIDDTTKVYNTKKGVSDVTIYDRKALQEEGLTPEQVIELKGLAGDSSDNIPGALGIGDKTARALLLEYGSIDNIYNNLDKIKENIRKKLDISKDMVYLSKKLATIDTDVEIDCNLDDMRLIYPLDKKAIKTMQKLEFRNLINRFEYRLGAEEEVEESKKIEVLTEKVDTVELLETIVNDIEKNQKIVINWGENVIIAVQDREYVISISNDLFGEGIEPYSVAAVLRKLYTEDYINVCFDVKLEMHVLKQMGIIIKKPYEDLQLKAYLINSSRSVSGVNELMDIYNLDKENYSHSMLELNDILDKKLIENKLEKLYYEIELPLVECLYDMEVTGFRIDKEMLESLSLMYDDELKLLIQEIYTIAGEKFNINSTKQLGMILFDKLELPAKKKTKTGYSVSAEVLEGLEHPIVSSILRYRQITKLKSTYIEGMKSLMNRTTGRVHTSFKQCLTTTGRLSSIEPNLQNIPIRTMEGREIRKIFVASPGCKLVCADYSQIELRLLAHFSNDKKLIDAYKQADDIHLITASKIYNVPPEQVDKDMRNSAKAVNFGIIYGISSFGLSRNLAISMTKAKRYIDDYFNNYPGVKLFMQGNVEKAKQQGYLKTFMGRIRHFPEFKSPNYMVRTFGKRAAMNMPLQGAASDIIKMAMNKVHKKLREDNLQAKLILQVHDELIIDSPVEEAERIEKLLKECMENVVELKVPLLVNVSSGINWYQAK
ncbi:MAG: DNA polymerase I [Bacillota bacterium]